MLDPLEAKRVVQQVFELTGRVLPEDDPLTIAALFQSLAVREAGNEAARVIVAASAAASEQAVQLATQAANERRLLAEEATRIATQVAAQAANERRLFAEEAARLTAQASAQVANERRLLAEAFDGKVKKLLGQASREVRYQSGGPLLLPRHLLLSFFIGTAVVLAVEFAVFGFSFSWVREVEVGRQYLKAAPTFDSDLRKRIIEQIQKNG